MKSVLFHLVTHVYCFFLDLKKHLYILFSQFGPVIDIVAMKTPKMRGQAFVVFREIPMATNALRSMQGFTFFDKPMVCTFISTENFSIICVDKDLL